RGLPRLSIEDTPVTRVAVLQDAFDLATVVCRSFSSVFNEIKAHPHGSSRHRDPRHTSPRRKRQSKERDDSVQHACVRLAERSSKHVTCHYRRLSEVSGIGWPITRQQYEFLLAKAIVTIS